MPLVTRYANLKKASNDGSGRFWPFKPLRAVGLAFELGLKLNKEQKSFQEVTAADLSKVHLSGGLQVFEHGQWKSAYSRTMQLAESDSAFALKLLHKVRNFIGQDLHGNIWDVDAPVPRTQIRLDLICEFPFKEYMALNGKVWVECKQVAAASFGETLTSLEEHLLLKLDKVQRHRPEISHVMYVVTKNEEKFSGGWAEPGMVCKYYSTEKEKWVNVSPAGLRVVRGQVPLTHKLPVAEVWSKVFFVQAGPGPKKGVFKHLLKAAGLPGGNAGKRASTLNGQLQKLKIRGKPFKGRLVNSFKVKQLSGKKPWLGTKAVLAQVYKFL